MGQNRSSSDRSKKGSKMTHFWGILAKIQWRRGILDLGNSGKSAGYPADLPTKSVKISRFCRFWLGRFLGKFGRFGQNLVKLGLGSFWRICLERQVLPPSAAPLRDAAGTTKWDKAHFVVRRQKWSILISLSFFGILINFDQAEVISWTLVWDLFRSRSGSLRGSWPASAEKIDLRSIFNYGMCCF